MKKILAVVLVIAILFSFAACGKADVLTGTWEGTTDGGSASWTFKGGKCTLHIDNSGFTIENEGTYEIDEAAGTVTINMEAWSEAKVYSYTLNGSSLSLTANDVYSPNYELTKK